MKNKNGFFISCALIMLANTMHGMHAVKRAVHQTRTHKRVARVTAKRTHYSVYKEPKECERATAPAAAQKLYVEFGDAYFEKNALLQTIHKDLPRISSEENADMSHCLANELLQKLVHNAVENKHRDADYADLINALGERGWYVHYDCCKATALHKAVEHNLFAVAKALIQSSGDNLIKDDEKGRVPHHYIRSREMAELIVFKYGIGGLINAQDHEGNTPLHLVPGEVVDFMVAYGADPRKENKMPFFKHTYQTFLRKAVADADVEKCKAIFSTKRPVLFVNEFEYHLLKPYIALRLYETAGELDRFDNKLYRQIACMLEETRAHKR